MKKKLILGLGALGMALAVLPMFAAFEAHVVNVTATIENALFVPVKEIQFGTVFPQEELDRPLSISLSQSFQDEDRVDDVEYMIRQKPKCGLPVPNTDPVTYSAYGLATEDPEGEGTFICVDDGYVLLPLLCPYLSKHSEVVGEDENGRPTYEDGFLDAFHGPIANWSLDDTVIYQVDGHLAKSSGDLTDTWNIDLKVPCFGGFCAQDWEDFVTGINPAAIPANYVQPAEKEHQIFGCDLWVEVTGISLPGIGCKEKIDLMLVLDRSGSINSTELGQLKTSAKAFVDALAPTVDGVHIGQSSFATNGSLDLHLNDTTATIKAAIDALVAVGYTNLKEGIDLAKGELDNPGDSHDRADADSPDFMVIITDGAPNEPGTDTEAKAAATASANLAKAAGVTIYVVGVGTVPSAADYLKNNIASSPSHYFDVADYTTLQATLEALLECAANGTAG